jgi:hypothetical protein
MRKIKQLSQPLEITNPADKEIPTVLTITLLIQDMVTTRWCMPFNARLNAKHRQKMLALP